MELVKKKRSKHLVLVLIIGFIFINIISNAEDIGMDTIIENCGGNFKEIDINGHVSIKNNMDESEAYSIVEDIASKLELNNIKIDNNSDEDIVQINGNYISDKYSMYIIVQSNKNNLKDTNIVVDYNSNKDKKVEEIKNNIRNALKEYGEVNYYICYTSSFDQNMDKKEKTKVVNSLIKKYNIDIKERYEDKNIVSVTGYTSRLKEWIKYDDKKVNINIAVRYNNYDEKTNLIIGYPLITIGY